MTDKEKWAEVMTLAEKYGFILQAYSGVAILATPEEQEKLKEEKEENKGAM